MTERSQDAGKAGIIRLLALLDVSRYRTARADEDGLEIAHGGRRHRFSGEILRHCLRTGLVEVSGSRLRLRPEGAALLRRMLDPAAGHLAQHADFAEPPAGAGAGTVRINLNESPLSRLHLRREASGKPWIDPAQFAAGERLRADFERAGLQPRISANWEASVASRGRGGTATEISDFALDARRRIDMALGTLDPDLAGVALDICCFLKGLEQVERERRWPPRSAKLMLRTALSILARHYGITQKQRSEGRIRHWAATGYRPAIASKP
jgi:hypothetical protein